jgi:transposase
MSCNPPFLAASQDSANAGGTPSTDRSPSARRRWTEAEKRYIVEESLTPGLSVSSVARRYGVAPHQLFRWRKHFEVTHSSSAGMQEDRVPAVFLLNAQQEIRELQRRLQEITREAHNLRQMVRGMAGRRIGR